MRETIFAAIASSLLLTPPAAAANWTVNSEVDAPDASIDGVCADAQGRCTLRAAVQEAEAAGGLETIEIPAGRFRLTATGAGENLAATGDLDFGSNPVVVRLEGAGAGVTSIEGKGDRVIDVLPGGDVQLYDLTVRKGRLPGDDGGGIRNAGTLYLYACRIEKNRTEGWGGGILSVGSLSLDDSSVLRNRAARGGGMFATGTLLDFDRGVVARNRADEGGGIWIQAVGTAGLENVTMSGNKAKESGGALGVTQVSTVTIVNVTIKGNRAREGGGLANRDGTSGVTVSNSILDHNGKQNCSGSIATAGGNLYSDATCPVGPLDLGDQRGLGLGRLADNGGPTLTHAIDVDSIAVDFGNGPMCSATDQRGLPRYDFPVGLGACDSGAFELQGP